MHSRCGYRGRVAVYENILHRYKITGRGEEEKREEERGRESESE